MVYVLKACWGEYIEEYGDRIVGIFLSLEEAQRAMQSFDFLDYFDYDDMDAAKEDCFEMSIMSFKLGDIVPIAHLECEYKFPE